VGPEDVRPAFYALGRGGWRDYVTLTKPRIMSLLLLTGGAAMVVGASGLPSLVRFAETIVGLGLACGGASALNHVIDRDIDKLMGSRTSARPVAAGRVPVIAGAGANATREAIELSLAAKKVGADGLLQVTPYYNKPSQEGMFRHFKAIVEACPLPTMLYNVPGRTGCDLLPETVARLAAEVPEIVGIKEATGSVLRASQILARVPSSFVVMSGDDAAAFSLFGLGAKGVISVVSNVAPAEMAEMWDAAAAGNWERARALHFKLLPLSEGLFIESNPVPVKSALAMMGRIVDELRPPLYPLVGPNREKVRAFMAQVGLL